jgi:hypothetical protein
MNTVSDRIPHAITVAIVIQRIPYEHALDAAIRDFGCCQKFGLHGPCLTPSSEVLGKFRICSEGMLKSCLGYA